MRRLPASSSRVPRRVLFSFIPATMFCRRRKLHTMAANWSPSNVEATRQKKGPKITWLGPVVTEDAKPARPFLTRR